MNTRNEQWLQWHGQGMTLSQIGQLAGVTRQRVHQVLVQMGVPTKPRAKMDAETVLRFRASPLSNRELARQSNISPYAIRAARLGFTWKRIA